MIDHRAVRARWRRLDVVVRDLPLGLLFLAASFLPVVQNHGTQLGGVPARPFDALAVVVVALESLPLAVRRRWPAACLTLVALGFAVDQFRGYHSVAGTALGVALVSAGAHLERRRRTTALVLSAAYVVLAIVLSPFGSEPVSEFVTFFLLLVFAWGIGAWLRTTRAAEAGHRRRVAEATRAAERATIARELHDVVTHHVTAMVVQAEAARYLTAAPDRLDRTLTAITDTGRRAITDLRHLLDLLNPEHETPSPGGLHALVEQARQAGQPVEFTEEGTPAESAGSADLVAYRVVQEALTNALKHAHGSRTEVEVHHGDRDIAVAVRTAGSGSVSPGGSGRGLAGLRERVGLLGGDFSADRDGAGFTVSARIPT
ncbi:MULTISPECIES: histidine kinase [unclassified Amycolatopsis]|uniref:sensor histidine kinase n=1 Tax=unclassified Amycolatopsis TaxID=2618356 RepID=UPI0028771C9C|nr:MULTISPECIES: histidine kinase [unclassified Amycolatopsis]MDS0135053.1 two-component sensor histidine kinase [Amycolatopsis sp. 505]MDS0143170.1 two-component sensor histidine kinase [Amycolatopsis sp. CM201R]